MKKAKQSKSLKFSVKNMGGVKTGEFTQKPLTVFCGPNNSGKTWVMYALRAFYYFADSSFNDETISSSYKAIFKDGEPSAKERKEIKKRRNETDLPRFNQLLNINLAGYFHISTELFKETNFECDYPQENWTRWVENYPSPYVFLMPAERNGLQLLYRELSNKRTALLHDASKEDINLNDLLRNVMHSRYARPIADYIDWLNNLTEQRKETNEFHAEVLYLQKKLAQGRYHVNRVTGDITYTPYKKQGIPVNSLGLHATSSTVKSLFGLWFYLEHQAKAGDILMIDEPELNIHPSNQLLIARLLARLVNAGIQVVISTHSDYIVREFNNLILLSEDTSGSLKKQYKYQTEEILKPDQVAPYIFDKHTIETLNYTPGQGFAISTFDDTITAQNNTNNEIYYGLQDQDEGMDE